ncbi:MAG: mannose-1-phosphate guanylyltransferase [Saprospiraceae bacterium]
MINNYIAIMAGGVGSRFWPASREAKPKQFLDILGVGKSLLQLTFERCAKIVPVENILVVTNATYTELVKEQLPLLNELNILQEPSRNNTAPCIAYTAFRLQAINPDANFAVAPSDHIILNEEAFIDVLQQALAFTAYHKSIVTIGIKPTRPDTGYGYINYDDTSGNVHPVKQFCEKPNFERAQAFLASGVYVWNAGIFVSTARTMLAAFAEYATDIYVLLANGLGKYNTEDEQSFINEVYPQTQSISIDYAIMEKADFVYTIPADLGWSDLGTWASLHEESSKDDQNNVVNGNRTMLYETSDCLIKVPKEKLVIIKDLHDYIVVDEEDVLVIFPKSKEQLIKEVTKDIRSKLGNTPLL